MPSEPKRRKPGPGAPAQGSRFAAVLRGSFPLRLLLAFASGLLLAYSFPHQAVPAFAFIALAPLLAAVVTARGGGEAAFLGWMTGSIQWLITVPWVIVVMSKYGGLPYATGVAIFVAMALVLGLYTALFALLVRRFRLGDPFLPWLLVPFAWTAVEYGRTYLLTGFPWNLLSVAIVDVRPLIQAVRVAGPYAVGFVLVAFSVVAAWIAVGRAPSTKRLAVGAIAVMSLVLWYVSGVLLLDFEFENARKEEKYRAALLQPNITQEMRWTSSMVFDIFAKMMKMTDDAIVAGAPLIVWPESTVPLTFLSPDNPFYRDMVEELSRKSGADIILGSVAEDARDPGAIWNAAYLVSNGEVGGRYDKIRLVPFGEYVPLRKILVFAEKLVREVGEFRFGESGEPLRGKASYGPAICYEIVYPRLTANQIRNGADVLVTITNDGWFGDTAAPYQHLNNARLRAIEGDRYLLRAATSGITALVDPTGKVVDQIGMNREGTIDAQFGRRSTLTPYVRFGDWFAILAVAAALLAAILRRKVSVR
jgi:apolipoprotein N-acyltransferase